MKLAVIVSLFVASHALASPPAFIPGYVNRRQPTTHVHDEHKSPFVKRDAMLAAAVAHAAQLQAKTEPGPYTVWNVLGGNAKSTARIIDYQNGQVTLQKRDGTTRMVREVRMGKVDRAAVDTWKKKPATPQATFPPIGK